jgi:glycosyltransferase involved in cell wall biosynthesis
MTTDLSQLTVCVPVGPDPLYKDFLPECLESILSQTKPPVEILVMNDAAGDLNLEGWKRSLESLGGFFFEWRAPWLSGPVTMWNYGVALAANPYTLLMGSDDKLSLTALERAEQTINQVNDPLGWYNFSCWIDAENKMVNWFNNAAVVGRELWKKLGGFHPFLATGGMDAALISIMMVHLPQHLHKIAESEALYWVREHPAQYGKSSGSRYWAFMNQLRNDLTAEWKEPDWTKNV